MANESVVDMLLNHETIDLAISLGEGNGNALCTVVSTVYGSRWNYDKRIELVIMLTQWSCSQMICVSMNRI